MSTPTLRSQEEIRIEMKSRFDAVNKAAEERRQERRDASELAVVEESRRWVKREAEATHVNELGENDTLGG